MTGGAIVEAGAGGVTVTAGVVESADVVAAVAFAGVGVDLTGAGEGGAASADVGVGVALGVEAGGATVAWTASPFSVVSSASAVDALVSALVARVSAFPRACLYFLITVRNFSTSSSLFLPRFCVSSNYWRRN